MYYGLKIGAFFAKYIPRYIGHKIIGFFGFIYGLMPTSTSKRIRRVQQKVSPELDGMKLVLSSAKVLRSYSKYWFDIFWLSTRRSRTAIDKNISAPEFNRVKKIIDQQKKESKGTIFVLPHIGSFELAGAWVANQGYEPMVVAERLKPEKLFDLFTKTRNAIGLSVIAHDDNPTAKIMDHLNQGGVVCLVADRDFSRRGMEIDFFGTKKTFPAGPAALSYKTNSVIIPVCSYIETNSKINLTFGDPIYFDKQDFDKEQYIAKTMETIVSKFEEMIRKKPYQWHVLHYEWRDK